MKWSLKLSQWLVMTSSGEGRRLRQVWLKLFCRSTSMPRRKLRWCSVLVTFSPIRSSWQQRINICILNQPLKTHTHTHTFNGPFPGLPGWTGTRKVKSIWILLKQETVSGSGISWAIFKSAPRSRQITTPATHHSVFYRPDALPAAQPTVESTNKCPKFSLVQFLGSLMQGWGCSQCTSKWMTFFTCLII